MLATNKWRLLTIVAGLLLAHAIDSPLANSPKSLTKQPNTFNALDGVTLQQFSPTAVGVKRSGRSAAARNLYQPYNVFSKIDNVRFTASKHVSNDRADRQMFGSFRFTNNDRRRSDTMPEDNSSLPVAAGARSRNIRKNSQYSFIPLNQFKDPDSPSNTLMHRTDDNIANSTVLDGIQSRTDTNIYRDISTSSSAKIVFPTDVTRNQHDITGRRSGIQFAAQSQKLETPFQPQGYREDNPSSPNYQFPYIEELSLGGLETDTRFSRGIPFEQQRVPSTIQQQISSNPQIAFRDDVTKFGDVNGPITSLQQRQYNDYTDIRPFTIRPYDTSGGYYTSSYDEFSRSPRFNSPPPNKIVDYSDYPGPPRSRLITPWKSARTPRVVFPQNTGEESSFPTGTAAGSTGASYSSDNVVFR